MRWSVRSFVTLAFTGALVLAGCSAGGAPAASPSTTADPTPTPTSTSTADPTPTPSATPVPTTDGQGDEYLVGTWKDVLLIQQYTSKVVGDVKQLRGGVVELTSAMNDPRVSGKATFAFSVDVYTKVGPEWGTFQLKNAEGSWDGTCTGGTWDDGNSAIWSCWLAGGGSYQGDTAYLQADGAAYPAPLAVQGIIYRGPQPKP